MDNEVTKDIVSMICNNYLDLILINIEENKTSFPYTICCINFISELKSKGIVLEINDIFSDKFIDKIYKEFSNYIIGGSNNE
ncbi:MAG: hypothetical protein KH135_00765 [Firmicutes bacterium]|nr:hypothetical protein [Bacillota bacterium]